jgi:hypothetical protein
MTPIIPRTYVELLRGNPGPLYWMNEQSGRLPEAVRAYLDHCCGEGPDLTADQFVLLRDYCAYWIEAPCWRGRCGSIEDLRGEIESVCTTEELREWLYRALKVGIDPL